MVDITLFEINLPEGASFNASNKAPLLGGRGKGGDDQSEGSKSSGLKIGGLGKRSKSDSDSDSDADSEMESLGGDSESEDQSDADADSGSSGPGKGVSLLGLVLLAALVVAARTLKGGDDAEELEELDDLSEMDVEAGE